MIGSATPRVCSHPGYSVSAAGEAIELAAMAGLALDAAQRFVLERGLGETEEGRWAASEVALVAPRQNGKNGVVEARELAGLFLFGEELIIHSAHRADATQEAFRRLERLIRAVPEFERRVKKWNRTHGHEAIELTSGARIRYSSRVASAGRSFSADLVVFDEAMKLAASTLGDMVPVTAARPNPQIWYTASAVDQLVQEHGFVLARLRERGHKGEDPSLAYFEWGLDFDNPDDVPAEVAASEEAVAAANSAYGIRIFREQVEAERRAMGAREFAVERLGVGDWPDISGEASHVLDLEQWRLLTDPRSAIKGRLAFALDVTPDRSMAAISVAGGRQDGNRHIEVVDHRRGTGWVVDRLVELNERHEPALISFDGRSPAASLVPELERAGLPLHPVTAGEHAAACGMIYDAVEQGTIRHLGQQMLNAAVAGAARRPLGEAWAWSRRSSAVDISPLVACTLALFAFAQGGDEPAPALVAWA